MSIFTSVKFHGVKLRFNPKSRHVLSIFSPNKIYKYKKKIPDFSRKVIFSK